MKSSRKGKAFIAVVLALVMMFSMNTAVFAAGAATEYTVDFYDGGVYKTTATLTYNAIGAGLPDCGTDGWQFETYLVSDEDGTEILQEGYSYTSSADNNVVTQELMDMLSGSVDVGSAGYTLRYKAYTNREGSGGADDTSVGRNAMSSLGNWQEKMFDLMGYASVSSGNNKYFAEGTAAPEETVFRFLNMTEEVNAYTDEAGNIDIPYEAYMNIANAYFKNAPEMKTYLVDANLMDAQSEQIHYYLGGVGSDWAWVLCDADYYYDSDADVYGYKLRGIFCNGWVADTTGLTEYVDYYVYNGSTFKIDSAVELTLVEDETYGYRIAAYTEKDYYLADTAEMGDCIYAYNEETGSFSDVYYCIYSNSGDYGIIFEYEDDTYTSMDNHLCYAADQKVVWKTAHNGNSAYDYECREVTVMRTFEGKETTTIDGASGVISGGGEVWLLSTPCVEFKIEAPHCTVELLQGLTDRGDGTYSYYETDAIELKITPDTGYEVTEVASYLYDVYVVKGTYISVSGTWLICPEFIPSTILVTTKETGENTTATTPTDESVTIVSGADSAAAVTVQVPKKEAEKVEGLTLVVEELEEKVEEKAVSIVAGHLGEENENVYILDIHFVNADGEEIKVEASMVVTVPIPEGWDPANVSVYYVNTDTGEVVDMKAVVSEDGKTAVFTTNHFSYYALVQKTASNPAESTPSGGNDTTKPQTGDNSNLSLWFAMLILAGAGLTGMGVYVRKRKYQR